MELGIDEIPIKGMGQRLLELKELLGFETINSFCSFLLINPTTFHRITHRNPTDTAYLSTPMLHRLVMRIQNLNLTWLLTGVGTPFIDHDSLYVKDKLTFYRSELVDLQQRLVDLHEMISEEIKDEKFHQHYIEYWEEEMKKMVRKKAEAKHLISLGSTERIMVQQLLDGAKLQVYENGQIRLIYGKIRSYIPKRRIERLVNKKVLVLRENESRTNSYQINPKLKNKIIKSV